MAIDLTAIQSSARRKISFTLTSTDYPDADLNANANEWYREILAWALEVTGIWEINGEQAFSSLVADQNEYVLPTSGFLILNRVEIKYPDATEYVRAERLDDKEIQNEAFIDGSLDAYGSTGAPVYRVFDNSLFIYPAADSAVTNGLSIEYLADVTDLSAGGDIPNLNPLVRQGIALGAAYEFASTEEMNQLAKRLYNRIYGTSHADQNSLKYRVQMLAAQRDRSVKSSIRPRRKSYR